MTESDNTVRAPRVLDLFEAFGVELEVMIVDAATFDVLPLAEKLLQSPGGEVVLEVERGPLAWSNELVCHVIELKTNGPAPSLAPLAEHFDAGLQQIRGLLAPHGATLLPGGMHPWMLPEERVLWPHGQREIYQAFDRIFGSKGHGWCNLQSVHLNLPFASDESFRRLHSAIRIVLPLLPALAAASPYCEGVHRGQLDHRLEVYGTNAARLPSIAGAIIPDVSTSEAHYREHVLAPMYADIAPFDPEGILQDEWLNARGAIARFDRNAIEIRIIDTQECPLAAISILAATVALLRALVEERFVPLAAQEVVSTTDLAKLYRRAVREGEQATVESAEVLALFGQRAPIALGRLWRSLFEGASGTRPHLDLPKFAEAPLEVLLREGPLARRQLRQLGAQPTRAQLRAQAVELAQAQAEGRLWLPEYPTAG